MEEITLRRKINGKLAMLGMTQSSLAKQIGVSRQFFNLVLNGRVKSEKVVKGIADFAEVSTDEVLEMVKNAG
jgi:DNA-binding XRE family transcriptional regulator